MCGYPFENASQKFNFIQLDLLPAQECAGYWTEAIQTSLGMQTWTDHCVFRLQFAKCLSVTPDGARERIQLQTEAVRWLNT